MHPDPFTAIQNALQFYGVDEIVISTFPASRSGWLRGDLIERVRASTGKGRARRRQPVRSRRGSNRLMESPASRSGIAPRRPPHGPPEANQSSRVDAQMLGMLLFIISEVMLFGAFFTAYFFFRVVKNDPWPADGTELPVLIAGVNTAILVSS